MTPSIAQLTPFTCALDCWAHFMRERGFAITTADLLSNHRDLCFHPPPNVHIYGAIDKHRFGFLVQRYLFRLRDLAPTGLKDIETEIAANHAVFVFAKNYHGNNHAMRISGVSGGEADVLVPAFPHGSIERATLDQIINNWKSELVVVE